MALNTKNVSQYLQDFEFNRLFTEELGWNQPKNPRAVVFDVGGQTYRRKEIADLAGVKVFEIVLSDTDLPDAKVHAAIQQEIMKVARENLLIFLDEKRTKSVWYWVKLQGKKRTPRTHYYYQGQPGDLFISKLNGMLVDFSEIEKLTITEAARRLAQALDVEQVTKKFYQEFKDRFDNFQIDGIPNERDKRWYTSVLLNRLMFIYFLQRKGFINHKAYDYLQDKLTESKARGQDRYYSEFLEALFFEGFAKPEEGNHRSDTAKKLIGTVPYLNGGLFLKHPIEIKYDGQIKIADSTFETILTLFDSYSWNLDDRPEGKSNEINPDVLGYIFEKYINQRKAFGAYYTRPEITDYLCRQTIHSLILAKVKELTGRTFESVEVMLVRKLDARLCRALLMEILPKLSLLDPACGSGAFLVAALKTLINIYTAVLRVIPDLGDVTLSAELQKFGNTDARRIYNVKRRIITDNLFGVDLYEEANEIAKLRLFLALVASATSVDELEPLPNIDFNVLAGNSLIGLLRVDETQYNLMLGGKPYRDLVEEKNLLVRSYRSASTYNVDLQALRDDIQQHRAEACDQLNEVLLTQFSQLNIKYEQAEWESAKNHEKYTKRALRISDIEILHPFHWGYEFDEVMNVRGGFDAIITNPPWEIFKPQAKEFFADYSEVVTKNKMSIKDFEDKQGEILRSNTEIQAAWEKYLSSFPYQSSFFRSAKQYENQISVVNGKKTGTDINLYKLFTEQCYNLLRDGGQCGIVIPSGIYTDLGAKQLREMFFAKTHITGLFGFENRKAIFEGVHSSFKFVVLTFAKGGTTVHFPAAFMRLDTQELEYFPAQDALPVSVDLVRKLSPDSLSIMEFKDDTDVVIAQKMLQFPLLGQKISDHWNLDLESGFHMTNDSYLFHNTSSKSRLVLYEGKMAHQFTHQWAGTQPKYWIEEKEGRKALLGKTQDIGQTLDYQNYRLAHRRIGSNTNERTMIATIIPKNVFASESFNLSSGSSLNRLELLYLVSILNSFVCDFGLRQRVTANINMFFVYQLPVPRLTEGKSMFPPLVERAARLICTTPEFADLWQEVMGTTWSVDLAATDNMERAKLRAEIDGLVAHLYGLTESEFAHILNTFPLVGQPVKVAAQNAYRDFAPNPELIALIRQGEDEYLEFKVAAYWNTYTGKKDDKMVNNIIEGVAGFLNSTKGGTLIIGVANDGTIVGLKDDYTAANAQKADRDGYILALNNAIGNRLGSDLTLFYEINCVDLYGKELCRINIKPSAKPVFLDGHLYVRAGNQKKKLSTQEALDYIKHRWG